MGREIYEQLAVHLATLCMGLPNRAELLPILESSLSAEEAEVALALPTRVLPLQVAGLSEIAGRSGYAPAKLAGILDGLAERGFLFCGRTADGERGWALHQVGFGFPQAFFWKGEKTAQAAKMAGLLAKYFNRQVIREAFGGSPTQGYRYIPVKKTLTPDIQAVYPHHLMETVVKQAKVFAVAHCPCRIMFKLRGGQCDHPEEVCLKFDDMAEYLIERGLGRQITREEALGVIARSEEAGLVHFVDNAVGDVKHNCNCCGCACWNVGNIKRRKIPRDVLMATYFMRRTDAAACSGCGNCVTLCPVNAVTMADGLPVVDEEWCIGCGVCSRDCPTDAVQLALRSDVEQVVPANFRQLYERIMSEKGLG